MLSSSTSLFSILGLVETFSKSVFVSRELPCCQRYSQPSQGWLNACIED
jgi:hypothetical protein